MRDGRIILGAPLAGFFVMVGALLSCGGCGSSSKSAVSGIPAVEHFNTYMGTQSLSGDGLVPYAGGVWGLTFDTDTNYFSYSNTTAKPIADPTNPAQSLPAQGKYKNTNGVLKLGLYPSGNGGYGIEVPGRAALLRPGDSTNGPIVAVQTNACSRFPANTVFQFVTLGVGRSGTSQSDNISYGAYGSMQASVVGATWSFSKYSLFALDGTVLKPEQLPSGSCATTADGYVVSILPTATTKNVPLAVAVGPTGFFAIDQGQAVLVPYHGNPLNLRPTPADEFGPFGLAGVIQPASPLNTIDVAGGKYIGFKYDTLASTLRARGSTVTIPTTAPVAFGQVAGNVTTLTGGEFPGDDSKQPPSANITIDLGQQDAQSNGLYKSVTVTIPDPQNACAAQPYGGTDAAGNPTCTLSGVAVVGNPEGKYAIFLTIYDKRALAFTYAPTALEFFLYQQ